MNEYICLLLAMCSSALLSIMSMVFGKGNKKENTSGIYSVILTFSAFVMWAVVCVVEGKFNALVIKFSLLFGVFYTVAMIGMFKAYQSGSVSLTAFVKQLSLIGVAFWGLLFWKNPLTLNVVLGIVLIIIALYLCFRPEQKEEKIVSAKWLLYAIMLLVGNAGCSIVQKYQQMEFVGEYKSIFMLFGAGVAFVSSLMFYIKGRQATIKDINPLTIFCPIVGGISSASLNLLILLLIDSPLSESIIFPAIAVGGLLITTLFSVVAYKEKLNKLQKTGFFVGIIALVLLNI